MNMSWQNCVLDNEYEIWGDFPYQIRKKSNHRIIKECLDNGYVVCTLNGRKYLKHRIIALQFLPNPENLPEVDHKNNNRADNRLENLRWVSSSQNNRNKTAYNGIEAVYLDDLPNGSIQIRNHNNFDFVDYHIDRQGNIYRFNDVRYYRLVVDRHNQVKMRDIENRPHHFSVNGLRKAFL